MKIHAFFGLCLLAITVSIAYGQDLGPAILPAPSQVAPVAPPSLEPCPGKRGGLIGFLQQVTYLVNNILSNVGEILSADSNNSQGLSVIPVLRQLLQQVRALVVGLLGGTSLTNAQVLTQQVKGENLVVNIKSLLDSLLGDDEGTKFACARPNGLIGGLLERVINLLGRILNGSWAHDRGLVVGLLGQIVVTVNSVLSNLQ